MGAGDFGLRVLLMAVYFESTNDWGSVQVSDSFSNYVLWRKGQAYSTSGQAAATQRWNMQIPMPPSGARAIVAFELPLGAAPLSFYQKFMGTYQLADIYCSDVYTMGQKLNYYVFIPSDDPAIDLEPAKGLFCVWNEAGKLIYDSEAPYLKILDYREHYYNQGQWSKVYPNAKRLGVVISQPQWYVDGSGGPGGGWGNLAGTSAYVDPANPNRIIFDYMLFRRTTVGNQWPTAGGAKPPMCKMLVCDLTKMDEIPFNL